MIPAITISPSLLLALLALLGHRGQQERKEMTELQELLDTTAGLDLKGLLANLAPLAIPEKKEYQATTEPLEPLAN
jgi:hypothetical protein